MAYTGSNNGASIIQPTNALDGPSAPDSDEAARNLPLMDINSDTIEESYVQFMLFCNPYLPLSTDTSELRRGFRSMPKTDGKTFSIFTLFELIKKLEAKDIETWSQLVVEMGVEPPDLTKNQSTQKVQQYAVRLKVIIPKNRMRPRTSKDMVC